MRPVLIVGGGQGGVSTAESLRDRGYDGPIRMLDAGSEVPYRRPPLSKAYLTGQADAAGLRFRPESFYAELGIDLLLGTAMAGIDHSARQLLLADGSRLDYDHLVLATGSAPRPWPGPGAGLEGVLQLATLEDADRMRAALAGAGSLTIIGGGFIGLEAASTAIKAGLSVTVLEAADRVMARALTPFSSEHLVQRHRELGVDLRTGVLVEQLLGDGRAVTGVRLVSGETIPSDLVLVSVGSAANVAGLSAELVDEQLRAIRVDELLLTADSNVSAIGDAAAFLRGGARIRLESVQNATDQARAVAARLTGDPAPYAAVPWFWTEQAGVKVQMAGLTAAADSFVVRGDPAGDRFSVFAFDGQELRGAESFGRPGDHIAVRTLLGAEAELSPAQAADLDFDLAAHARSAALSPV